MDLSRLAIWQSAGGFKGPTVIKTLVLFSHNNTSQNSTSQSLSQRTLERKGKRPGRNLLQPGKTSRIFAQLWSQTVTGKQKQKLSQKQKAGC